MSNKHQKRKKLLALKRLEDAAKEVHSAVVEQSLPIDCELPLAKSSEILPAELLEVTDEEISQPTKKTKKNSKKQ